MTELESLQHIAVGCLLDKQHRDHDVTGLIDRGLVHFPFTGGLPYLTRIGKDRLLELTRCERLGIRVPKGGGRK